MIVEIDNLLKEIEIDYSNIEQKVNESIKVLLNDENDFVSLIFQIDCSFHRKEFLFKILLKIYEDNFNEIKNLNEFKHLHFII